ncbi:MAG: YfhO family protein [Acidobacteria bacterium]|jgi:hypothetical protein|nr:YfhO family protein [Acidobacteriota bacterium]
MALSFRTRRDLAVAGAALLLCVLLYPGALLRGELFFERDLHLDWYPRLEMLSGCLRAGAWPLWDTSIGFGQPLLADPGAQVAYPVTWLALAAPRWAAYSVFVLVHLIAGAVGMSRLAGRLGAGRLGAPVAAVLFVLLGPVQSSLNLWHHFAGLAWMPWVLLGVDRCVRRPRPNALFGLVAAATLQILAGSADVCAMTWTLAAVWTAFRLVKGHRGHPARALARLLLAAGLCAGLSAVVWWPAVDVVSRSPRQELPEDIRTAWSIPPFGLWRLVAPLDPDRVPFSAETWTALYDRPEQPFLASLYLGLVVLAAAAAAILSRRDRPRALLLAAAVIGGVAIALGPHGGVYPMVVELLPVLKVFRYPSKATLLVAFAVALLAGLGTGAVARGRLSPRALLGLSLAVLLTASAVAVVGASLWGSPGPQASPALAAAAAVVLALGARGNLRPRLVALALAGLGVGDLLLVHAALNATAPAALIFDPPPAVARVDREGRRRLYVYDYHSVPGTAERHLGRVNPYPVGPLPPGWRRKQVEAVSLRLYLLPPSAGLFGLEGSYDFDIRGLYPRPLNDLTFFLRHVEGTSVHTRLLRLGGVGTVLSLHDDGLEGLRSDGTLDSLFPEAIRVWRVPGEPARTWVVGGVRVADEREAFESLADPSFDPAMEVILPGGRPRRTPTSFVGTSRILGLAPDRVTLDVDASAPGFVVLADAFDPGWRATVDGQPARVHRANVAFRAVAVAEGRHVVEMVYRPRTVPQGLTLSTLSLLLVLGVGVAGVQRERRERRRRRR